jgi:hypothetical protein
MEQQQWICPTCSKAISSDDTFVLDSGRLSHLDCRRPHVLSPEERVVLFRFCSDTQSPSASSAPRDTVYLNSLQTCSAAGNTCVHSAAQT